MIQQIYSRYIHKSHVFLFPLLGLKRDTPVRPSQTYVRFKGLFVADDMRLFVMYPHCETDNRWKLYQRYNLLSHPMLERSAVTKDGDEKLFIFNLVEFEADIWHFVRGRYSQFSETAKSLISDYFGVHSAEWAHVQTFLFPQNHYIEYAQALSVEEDLLREAIELCSRYDKIKETLDVEMPDGFWDSIL